MLVRGPVVPQGGMSGTHLADGANFALDVHDDRQLAIHDVLLRHRGIDHHEVIAAQE